jgi:hypothetical protein
MSLPQQDVNEYPKKLTSFCIAMMIKFESVQRMLLIIM